MLTLAVDGADRTMFGGAYAVDNFALVVKALFLVAGYVTVLQSTNYIAEGDYAEGEYYFLLLSSILGMTVMALGPRPRHDLRRAGDCCRSPPTCWRAGASGTARATRRASKYYLMGVFATGVLLYGMSLLYGVAGSTKLSDIGAALAGAASRSR